MWRVASRVLGLSVIDLLTQPALLQAAQDEFDRRTGGGIGGSTWTAPLLSEEFVAPVNHRWPEYVDTPRGPEWTLPT